MNQEKLNQQLLCACANGELELVKKLVKDGADIHYRDKFTCTPFERACSYGHLDLVKWLYKQGADPTIDDNWALQDAGESGYLEIVKYLYSIGCRPTISSSSSNKYYKNYAIIWSSRYGNIEMVNYLALIGFDTDVIEYPEIKNTAEYYKKYKPIMDTCIAEIYGNPRLERTRTENEEYYLRIKNE